MIPVYAEAACLPDTLRRLAAALDAEPSPTEVVFVDDASPDGSLALLEGFAARQPCTRVLRFTRNYGQSSAMLAGFEAARAPVVVTMEAHPEHALSEVFRLASLLAGEPEVDVVAGVRLGRPSPAWRRAGSWALNRALRALDASPFDDLGFLLKAWRRDFGLAVFRAAHGRIQHGRLVEALRGARAINTPVRCTHSHSEPSAYRPAELVVAATRALAAAAALRVGLSPPRTRLPDPPYEVVE